MTDKKTTRIALSQITTLEQALDQVPARNATEISKARAIAILAPKLHALRAKGYAWRDVAAWLTEHGVSVTTPALQRYLRTAKPAAPTRDKRRAASGRSNVSGEAGTTTQGATRVQAAVAPPPAPRSASIPVQGGTEPSTKPQPPIRSGRRAKRWRTSGSTTSAPPSSRACPWSRFRNALRRVRRVALRAQGDDKGD